MQRSTAHIRCSMTLLTIEMSLLRYLETHTPSMNCLSMKYHGFLLGSKKHIMILS